MTADRDTVPEEALKTGRRMYDRHMQELDDIDDAALRTLRTDIIILGFVAAAVTAGGPDAASTLSLLTVAVAYFGSLLLVVSAFVCVGTYAVTEYPYETDLWNLWAASHTTAEQFEEGALGDLRSATADARAEVLENSKQLLIALMTLLVGTGLLVVSALMAILANSYGIRPVLSAGIAVGVLISVSLAAIVVGSFFTD